MIAGTRDSKFAVAEKTIEVRKLLPLLAQRVIGLRAGRIAFDLPVAQVNDEQLLMLYRGEPETLASVAYAAAAVQHTSRVNP